MTASDVGYGHVHGWVKRFLPGWHITVITTVAWVVVCLIVAQSLSPARLARAIPAEESGSARSRLRRVRRWWQGPELPIGKLSRHLIAFALTMLPVGEGLVVALDTTRTQCWEIWQAGIVFCGHTLPVAWAVSPYPWPKGRYREINLALIAQLQASFAEGKAWALVADRGFPCAEFFAQLLRGKTGWTVRLRLGDWVTVEGVYAKVLTHLEEGRLRPGQRVEASVGTGAKNYPRVRAAVVVSDQLPEPPKHKQNRGSEQQRAKQTKARADHLASRGRKHAPPSEAAKRYAQTWVLFTTAASVEEAVGQYAKRMSIEQTFRDWHYHWGLRAAVVQLSEEAAVQRMVGILSLAYLLQVGMGRLLSKDPVAQKRRAQWTVSDRVSLFWCGQKLFTDLGYDWRGWLAGQWKHLLVAEDDTVSELAA